jgi:U32 family peptidase
MNDKLNPAKIPELLAPAGNLESAITAFESGADAVYAGLEKFNARDMGDNFSTDDLSRLKAYTINHGKKFYLTFNTLIKENELEEFGSIINGASDFEPDAVIVQDIGAAAFIRDCFPSIDIHASTQMAIHNSAGVMEAAQMGIKRVILERQVSLEEIEQITKKSPLEIEIFIHGALCCSLSGQCLLSSWLGGYSGNRGKCKQPCRRIYQENKNKGFLLSPGDLCTADLIESFIKSGVSSLKIEGRLKRGDYIKNTVSSYRKMLDY